MGTLSKGPLTTLPKHSGSDDGTILGSWILVLSMPKKPSSFSSYSMVRRFMNIVLLALVLSVTWMGFSAFAPPFSLYMSQESTVPKARRPSSYACLTASSFWRSQRSLTLLGYVDRGRPQSSVRVSDPSRALSSRTSAFVRVSGHTTALQSGSPVVLSHTTVVSRWLVMPIDRMSDLEWPSSTNLRTAPSIHSSTDLSSSSGSCSCHLQRQL
jgi:hypothetical protein